MKNQFQLWIMPFEKKIQQYLQYIICITLNVSRENKLNVIEWL